jgi:hypothetical protein
MPFTKEQLIFGPSERAGLNWKEGVEDSANISRERTAEAKSENE